MKKLLIIVLVGLACWAQARLVRTWSHDELTKAADTVVVIEAVSTEKTNLEPDFLKLSGHPKEDYQAWVTTFKVLTVFKGAATVEKPLKIVYFTYSDRVGMVNNGAQFMKFVIGPMERELNMKDDGKGGPNRTWFKCHPSWLAYLKGREDGSFEPVTSQYDAVDSFKELITPQSPP